MTGVDDYNQPDPLLGTPFRLHGIFWGHDGAMTDVGALPGTNFAFPSAVNSRGEVVGQGLDTIPDSNGIYGWGSVAGILLGKRSDAGLGQFGHRNQCHRADDQRAWTSRWLVLHQFGPNRCLHPHLNHRHFHLGQEGWDEGQRQLLAAPVPTASLSTTRGRSSAAPL